MRHRGPRRLFCDVHGIGAVAIAAFKGIIGLESRASLGNPIAQDHFNVCHGSPATSA